MSAFDKAFADRVREVFDGYHEPVDPAALAQMRAALGHPSRLAADRAPVARPRSQARRGAWVALAAVLIAAAVWLQMQSVAPSPDPVAESTRLGESVDTPAPEAQPTIGPESESGALAGPLVSGAAPSASPSRQPASIPSSGEPEAGPPSGRRAALTPSRATASNPILPPVDVRPRPETTRLPSDPVADASTAGSAQRVPKVNLEPLPALASVPEAGWSPPSPLPYRPSARTTRATASDDASPYRITVSTSAPLAADSDVAGVGLAGGVTREWPVAGRVSVSGGAVVAYNRYDVGQARTLSGPSLSDLSNYPGRSLDIVSRTQAETVALELPLDLAFDVAGTRRTRLGVSVGVTSAVYLSQTSRVQGTSFSGLFGADSADGVVEIESQAFDESATGGVLSRVELARQLNLGVQLARRRGLSVEAYTRLPLAGLTDRNLDVTTVGVRLRVPIR